MEINIQVTPIKKHADACLILGIYDDGELSPSAKEVDRASGGYITRLIKQGGINGQIDQQLPVFAAIPAFPQLLLVGCGKKSDLNATLFRKIIISAIKNLVAYKIKHAICYLSELHVKQHDLAWKIKHITQASFEGLYCFDLFKSKKNPALVLKKLLIHLPQVHHQAAATTALKQGLAIAEGVILTKNLANTPSNVCTPTFLAEHAKVLAKSYPSLAVKILSEKEMQKLKMGAILGVSQGSAEEAKLICLEYKGRGAPKNQKPVALIGKGITFDTGGISLKTPDNLVGMKYDMCGAASVLGTLKAVATLQLPIHVVGIIAAVENMPGGTAYKPEDILVSLSGQTIEVISTDAEGRLILADALTYCERYQPDTVIDIATLTGAVVIALGHHATGLMSNHEPLTQDLIAASEESHDRVWPLPLWDDYQEQIKSPFADMANTGGRAAGSITAGCFLSRFAKSFHWAHLDVAGTAAMMMGNAERMATGRPVPLLTQYLINRCS